MEAFEVPPSAASGAKAEAAVAKARGAGGSGACACGTCAWGAGAWGAGFRFLAGGCHLDHGQTEAGQGQGDQASGEPSANDDDRIRGQAAWTCHAQICRRKEPITCSNRGLTLDQRASLVLVARVYRRPLSTTTVASSWRVRSAR